MPVLPRSVLREPNRIREVFLSATAKDVVEYRTNVRDILRGINTVVFLQEEWAVPAVGVVQLCLGRLAESDGYIGIFGFRYGWIPDGETRSITEIECDGALRRWQRETVPPIFFFMPALESDAARALEVAANAVFAESGADEAAKLDSRKRQKAFCDRLQSSGRHVSTFTTVQDLRDKAQASVSNWNVEILSRAVERRRVPAHVPPSELGRIGRTPQIEALEDALVTVRTAGEPGLALLVHGEEDAGQSAFISFLEDGYDWETSAPPLSILPPHERFDADSVVAAALAAIAPDRTSLTATIENLAQGLAARCRDEPVVLILRNVDRMMGGGLAAFRDRVWAPLVAAARARKQGAHGTHPFVLAASIAAPLRPPFPSGVQGGDVAAPIADWTMLRLLPELGRLSQKDIADWLRDVDARRVLTLQDRHQIAARITGDGVPRAVFDRLNQEGLWPRLNR